MSLLFYHFRICFIITPSRSRLVKARWIAVQASSRLRELSTTEDNNSKRGSMMENHEKNNTKNGKDKIEIQFLKFAIHFYGCKVFGFIPLH